jgi:hypothetical protein
MAEMNAPARLFLNARRTRLAARLLICAGAAALTSGCIGNPLKEAKVDPASPIAPEVAKLAHSNSDYPTFSEIPVKPADLRPARLYGQQAKEIQQVRDQIIAATAPGTWTLNNTDAFAASVRAQVGPELPPVDPSESEAFASDLRKRATPPPPPKR